MILKWTLLRLIGYHRYPPKNRFEKWLRHAERLATIIVFIWLALFFYPQVLFAHRISSDGITLYSTVALPPSSTNRIHEIAELVRQSELSIKGRSERIFICNGSPFYRLFGPTQRGSFAYSTLVRDNIFVAEADLDRNITRSSLPKYNERTFTGVAAHEITHGLIRAKLGFWRGVTLPHWLAEGYCDFVAQESSFPEGEGLKNLVSGNRDNSAAFDYFTWRKMVEHLSRDKKMTFLEMVRRAHETKEVKRETIEALQRRGQQ